MPLVTVTKYQGTGNDFILLDARDRPDHAYGPLAARLCHRRFSLGADGLLVIEHPASPACNAALRIFNADGSEARNCGNGLRCAAMFLRAEGRCAGDGCSIETPSGTMQAVFVTRAGETQVRVSLGVPDVSERPPLHHMPFAVSALFGVALGNAHVVAFTDGDLASIDLARFASMLNADGADANVEVANAKSAEILVRTYERGAGETWGCGTGACAAAAAAVVSGRAKSPLAVRSRGGFVEVEWAGPGQPAHLTGDARAVYRTQVEIPTATASAAT